MAANMGMAGNGHLLMQQQQNNQRQMQQIVYNQLVQNTPQIASGGWQSAVQINDRLGKTVNLYVCFWSFSLSCFKMFCVNILTVYPM